MILRIGALRELAKCIATEIPELDGSICAGHAEHPKRLALPSLAIIPSKFTFFPDQDGDVFTFDGDRVVFRVGRHEGNVLLRLGASSANERYRLEAELTELFESGGLLVGDDMRGPGILVLQVPGCENAVVAFEYEDSTWIDDNAFDKEWYAHLAVKAQIPALITRHGVHTIEDLQLSLTEDFDTPFDELTDVENVSIAVDGTITPV